MRSKNKKGIENMASDEENITSILVQHFIIGKNNH